MLTPTAKDRTRRRKVLALCAMVPVLALAPGCGDDGGGDGDLSGADKVEVVRARADIAEYCSVQGSPSSSLSNRSFGTMLESVAALGRAYQDHPDAKVEIPVEKKSFTMEQVMREQIRKLRSCGRDGRQQAGVLEAALQRQQS